MNDKLRQQIAPLDYALKRKGRKESGSRDNPKCSKGNYQCRGNKGVACISGSKGCKTNLENMPPGRRQFINETIEKLKQQGKSPPTLRMGKRLGAERIEISPEQYRKALSMNLSGRDLAAGNVTRQQLNEILKPDMSQDSASNNVAPLTGLKSLKSQINDPSTPEIVRDLAKEGDPDALSLLKQIKENDLLLRKAQTTSQKIIDKAARAAATAEKKAGTIERKLNDLLARQRRGESVAEEKIEEARAALVAATKDLEEKRARANRLAGKPEVPSKLRQAIDEQRDLIDALKRRQDEIDAND